MSYIPHTDADIQAMLKTIGIEKINQVFDEIPAELKQIDLTHLPEALNECELKRDLEQLLATQPRLNNFIGAGAYEHHIPQAILDLISRGEFLTAYTPYQPEASQGSLQVIYEYQTMMARLTGLEVSNASLYDGASALAEAILMALRLQKEQKNKIIIAKNLHPFYRETVKSIVGSQNFTFIDLEFDQATSLNNLNALKNINAEEIAAIVISQPNFFGGIEDLTEIANWAKSQQVISIAVGNPTAMALIKSPGECGFDIACGEGQALGVPLSFGGPYYGFLTCRKEMVRQMPGRIVGKTVDSDGKTGFVLTLQAREQHIRRAKATSNICTNQGLMVTASTIYMAMLGKEGLHRVALQSHRNAEALKNKLSKIDGVEILFNNANFHEFVFRSKKPAELILEKLAQNGISGGLALKKYYPELGEAILVCVTETKNAEDLEKYAQSLKTIVGNLHKEVELSRN